MFTMALIQECSLNEDHLGENFIMFLVVTEDIHTLNFLFPRSHMQKMKAMNHFHSQFFKDNDRFQKSILF